MIIRLTAFLVLTGMLCQPVLAADQQTIEDLLEARWFDIELIVFERLDVLDANSDEQLTQTRYRSWPANLLEVGPTAAVLTTDDGPPLAQDSVFCLGYPLLPDADPLHPLLQAQLDPVAAQQIELERTQLPLSDTQDSAENPVLSAPAGQADEATEAPRLPPVNAPQITLTPYLQFLADVAAFEGSLLQSSFQWLPDLTLQAEVKAINRQRNLRPLLHRRWRQPVPDRAAPQPIYIASTIDASAPATSLGFAKLEGYISVTVGRYLHFAPTLWYHADNLGLAPQPFPVTTSLPAPANNYMVLQESRRLRSGELHYLDHPKIGVIVRIDPVTIPESLRMAQQSLSGGSSAGNEGPLQ